MQIAEITRAETSHRADLLTVSSYTVDLDLTCGDKVFRSTSEISFQCAEPGARSYADLVAETVREITLNGEALDPDQVCAEGRILLPALAEQNELRVVADCAYTADSKGMHRAVDSADGKIYCYTNCEPADARRVFANFEQPDLKASFTFRVTAPAHWVVLSNQPAPEPEPAGADESGTETATWEFPPTPRISTYLTVVVAGDYHLVRDTHTTPAGQVIPLGLACRASLADYLEAADMFTLTKQGFDYYTQLFGAGYPFEKYDQVFVPEFAAGAMENVGCVTISERLLFRSKVTDMMYELRATVILHEMAHMWFGDLVTMKWWDDLWLNESFAEFSAALSSAEGTRFTDAWTTFSGSRKTWGYMQDQLPTTHPIAGDVPTLSEAIANFDGISYAKGASVLKQLVAHVGRDSFIAGIRAYFADHGWGNATLSDLLGALEASSGLSLGDWAKAWLQTAGPNTLRSEFSVAPDGTFEAFAVLQEASEEYPTLRPHHIAIGLYSRSADGALERTHRIEADVAGPRTEIAGLAGLPRPDLILLNDDDLSYAIVRFDERSLATLTESIGAFTDSLARTVAWSAVLDMVQQAELSVPAFVRILVGGMGEEPAVSVLQILHMTAARLMAVTADPRWLPEGKEQLATAALRLLRAAEPGSDHQLAWMQLLGWTAVTPEQLDFIAGLLDGSVAVPGLSVDTELRWALLRRLAVTGRAGDAEIDAELALDPTDAGRRHAAASRASIPDAEHKEAAWNLVARSQELGHEGVIAVAAGFGQPEHAGLLAPYVEAYFEVLPEIWETRGDHIRRLLGDGLFPYAAASPELLRRVDEFLAAEPRDPSMVRVLIERRDIIDRALRSRELPG
ncbi:MAG TPA: aminopeptidase N [Streptosporangiaceae bacterium]|jgi:aminopeptidase N|nr:aminopeptidase N [Streptosporangiaceae bacterium]